MFSIALDQCQMMLIDKSLRDHTFTFSRHGACLLNIFAKSICFIYKLPATLPQLAKVAGLGLVDADLNQRQEDLLI